MYEVFLPPSEGPKQSPETSFSRFDPANPPIDVGSLEQGSLDDLSGFLEVIGKGGIGYVYRLGVKCVEQALVLVYYAMPVMRDGSLKRPENLAEAISLFDSQRQKDAVSVFQETGVQVISFCRDMPYSMRSGLELIVRDK
jgi:hypothetical protein